MDTNTKAQLLVQARRKSGWLAALLNLVIPGAGYAYCGRWFLGIVAFIFCVALIVMSFGIAVPGLSLILFIDGFLAAGRYNRRVVEDVVLSAGDDRSAAPTVVVRNEIVASDYQTSTTGGRQERECPHCAEKILARANRCRFCNQVVTPIEIPESPSTPTTPSAGDSTSRRLEGHEPRSREVSFEATTRPDAPSWLVAVLVAVVLCGVFGFGGVYTWRHPGVYQTLRARLLGSRATSNVSASSDTTVTARDGGTARSSPSTAVGSNAPAVSDGLSASVANAIGQTPTRNESPWMLTASTDKLTDRKTLEATASVRVSGPSSPFYQLILKCVVGKTRDVSLATFDGAGQPRAIPFATRVEETGAASYVGDIRIPQEVVGTSRDIRYRMDSNTAESARLIFGEFSNAGRVALGQSVGANWFAGVLGIDLFSKSGLPTTRLVIVNVFPDETVEFSFAALTTDERAAIQTACFATEDAAAVAAANAVPRLLQEVKPQYTPQAMRAKVQGTVGLECVVLKDGSVSECKVLRSLDAKFGLDEQAINAARQWRFAPGTKDGVPTDMTVTLDMAFTLR
jgi:TonB family protein